MGITSALVLYAVIWFMTFLIVIPVRIETQGDRGEIVPGTQAGSPEVHNLRGKAWITTGLSVVLWCVIAGLIFSGWISMDAIERFSDWIYPKPSIL